MDKQNLLKLMGRILHIILYLHFVVISKSQEFIPGKSYFGDNEYIEYIAGNLPVIISAPHGGDITPNEIPDRNCPDCVHVKDAYTQELIMEIYQSLLEKTGCHAHIIINKLHRKKLDANRDLDEAANGNSFAANSWFDFHEYIETAKRKVTIDFGKGFYIDLHGHSHTKQRLEIGYLLFGSELRQPNSKINSQEFINYSSIKNLIITNINGLDHADLIKGDLSFGTLMSTKGYPSVPSKADPFPLVGDDYFSGGYNTERHGSNKSGTIDGIQVECNNEVRFETSKRLAFADKLASSILDYLDRHYFPEFNGSGCLSNSSEIQKIKTEIYPNPASEVLYISNKYNNISKISIFSQIGQQVWSGHSFEIQLNNLSPGLYFVRLENNFGYHEVHKFLKI